jgi:hypothetical protein
MVTPLYYAAVLAHVTPPPADRAAAAGRRLDAGPAAFVRALDTLQRSGSAPLPVRREALADDARLPSHACLLDAAVAAAGADALPLLAELLGEDYRYWHNLGLNIDDPAKISPARLARLEALLRHLDALGDRDAAGHAAALRSLFATHPIYRQAGLRCEF